MEYEAKFRVSSLEDVERTLRELGAVFEEEVFEEDHYIDLFPCVKLRERDEALRIRISKSNKTGFRGELTYKGPKIRKDLKVREELTTSVSDPFVVIEIFRRLGFKDHILRKTRRVYRLANYKIFLDKVEDIGSFVEIEVEGIERPEDLIEHIKRFKSLIGVTGDHIVKSYLEMWLEERGYG
ncbi:MAG: class IV adenylate cyclase [Sulfolobales archaeon]